MSLDIIKINQRIDGLVDSVINLQTRVDTLQNELKALDTDIKNEIYQSAIPLINSSIDASKPELRNYIRMIIKEELRLQGITQA